MNKTVFRGYHEMNVTIFEPKWGSHGAAYVYGTYDKTFAAIFSYNRFGGDFVLGIRRDSDGTPCLYERFSGAFEQAYEPAKNCCIYTLPEDSFKWYDFLWRDEVVSTVSVKPISQEHIPDVKEYLLDLEQQGKLRIYRYPNRPNGVPSDDKDLIYKAIKGRQLNTLKQFHPHLYQMLHNRNHG